MKIHLTTHAFAYPREPLGSLKLKTEGMAKETIKGAKNQVAAEVYGPIADINNPTADIAEKSALRTAGPAPAEQVVPNPVADIYGPVADIYQPSTDEVPLSPTTSKLSKLKDASQQVEAIFVKDLFAKMQAAVTDATKNGPYEDLAKDLFSQTIADSVGKNGGVGISTVLYNSLSKSLIAQEQAKAAKNPTAIDQSS